MATRTLYHSLPEAESSGVVTPLRGTEWSQPSSKVVKVIKYWIEVVKGNCSPSEWKAFRFLPVRVILTAEFSYIHFNILRIFSFTPNLWKIFIMNYHHFFASIEKIISFSFIGLLIWWIILFCFQMKKTTLHYQSTSQLLRIYSFLYVNSIFQYLTKFFFFFFFVISWAAPMAYGGSQARGWIGAVATGLGQSHSNAGSEPCRQPIPQLMAMLDR